MALTRPIVGDEVSAELFGQPVYDLLKGMLQFNGEGSASGITTVATTIPGCSTTWTAEPDFTYVVLGYARISVNQTSQRAIVQLMDGAAERGRLVDYAYVTGMSAISVGMCVEPIVNASGSLTRFIRANLAAGAASTMAVDLGRLVVLRFSSKVV